MHDGRTDTNARWVGAILLFVWAGACAGCSSTGQSNAASFVGTWARSGSQTVTCPGGTTVNTLTGNLVITLGSTSGTIIGTQPDGCVTTYSVNGNEATATPGQPCNVTTGAGVAEVVTVVSHTLTLSADGNSLDSNSSSKIDETATMTMCTGMGLNTYTKQ